MNNNLFPVRKPNRLSGYDYSLSNTYFLKICAKDKRKFFGKIVGAPDGRPYDTENGESVQRLCN